LLWCGGKVAEGWEMLSFFLEGQVGGALEL
jgi:hypothetical protein